MIDTTDFTEHAGDLGYLVQEAHGHAADCGRSYASDAHALSYVEHVFEGGLAAFIVAVSPLAA